MKNIAQRLLPYCCLCSLMGGCAPGTPSSEDLQRQCDRDASAWFLAQHPDGVTRETVDSAIRTEQYTFSDHYNPRLRQCLVIASEEKSVVYSDKPSEGSTGKVLVDLSTQAALGRIVNPWPATRGTLRQCQVGARQCTSMQEWKELAAPYMER